MPSFFADECVAGRIVAGLRRHGLDVADAKEVCQGDTDDRALALAAMAGRVLITEDRGFGELAIRHHQKAVGIIVIALYAMASGVRERYAVDRIVEIAGQSLGNLMIIEPGRIRTRPLS